jgi:uncharacterized protein (DUF1810 family)
MYGVPPSGGETCKSKVCPKNPNDCDFKDAPPPEGGTPSRPDPHKLNRFVQAQDGTYAQALAEIQNGRKRSHWMWFIFPQFAGLGFSSTAQFYAIKSVEEAKTYMNHPLLGARLVECADALLRLQGRSAEEIFGYPDYLKLRSCTTLFAEVSPAGSCFHQLLAKYYPEGPDRRTIELLQNG